MYVCARMYECMSVVFVCTHCWFYLPWTTMGCICCGIHLMLLVLKSEWIMMSVFRWMTVILIKPFAIVVIIFLSYGPFSISQTNLLWFQTHSIHSLFVLWLSCLSIKKVRPKSPAAPFTWISAYISLFHFLFCCIAYKTGGLVCLLCFFVVCFQHMLLLKRKKDVFVRIRMGGILYGTFGVSILWQNINVMIVALSMSIIAIIRCLGFSIFPFVV